MHCRHYCHWTFTLQMWQKSGVHSILRGKIMQWPPTELNKKSEPVQVATLLTVTGEDAREVYSTFNAWTQEGDHQPIKPVYKGLLSTARQGRTSRSNATNSTGKRTGLGKPGTEEEEQPPKSPSQNQHRSC